MSRSRLRGRWPARVRAVHRPAEFNGEGVPPVLVSGDHAKVDAWRRKNAIERTCRWRPDLIETARLTPEERAYAQEILDASYSQSEE